jgi:hypothetical protein
LTASLLDEFQLIIDSLNAAGVDYAVAGALALAIYGAPRATTDIDLIVAPADVERVLDAVRPLGFALPAQPMKFSSGIRVQRVTKVVEGNAMTLDLLLAEGPLESAWSSRVTVEALDRKLSVVSRQALVEMKALAGRLQDLADIARLQGDADEP